MRLQAPPLFPIASQTITNDNSIRCTYQHSTILCNHMQSPEEIEGDFLFPQAACR